MNGENGLNEGGWQRRVMRGLGEFDPLVSRGRKNTVLPHSRAETVWFISQR